MARENPVEAYFKVKQAGFFRGVRGGIGTSTAAGYGIGQGLMGAAGGLVAAGGVAMAQGLYDAATKSRDFRLMLEENPDVAAAQQENPHQINRMFSTLRTFNPDFSRDPLVAGDYMRRMIAEPNFAGGVVVDVLQFRKHLTQPVLQAVNAAALKGIAQKGAGRRP